MDSITFVATVRLVIPIVRILQKNDDKDVRDIDEILNIDLDRFFDSILSLDQGYTSSSIAPLNAATRMLS